MTASYFGNEHHVALQHREVSENTAVSVALDTSDHRVAPVVSDPREAMRPDRCGGGVSLGTIQEMAHALDAPNLAITRQQIDSQILQNYQREENNLHHLSGAKRFLAHLHGQQRSLTEVTKRDLEQWALTPNPAGRGKGDLPSARIFQGAKGLCALAAQAGCIDAQRAKNIAECTRPHIELNVLRRHLQNPLLTRQERESLVRLSYQSAENDPLRKAGAIDFLGYLASQNTSLAEVTTSDLERWGLTTRTDKLSVPSARAFEGAKALCALAREVGYIDMRGAKELAEFKRPYFGVDLLRSLLQNPALTGKEREDHILLNYQSSEKNSNRYSGAASFQAYLESAEIPLSAVSANDLKCWALTPTRSKRNLPDAQGFEGAKALCALAAEVGHIDLPRAQELATCKRPQLDVDSLRMMLQNPGLSRQEREYQISLTYQSCENNHNRHAGARGILAYLEKQAKPLSELTTTDLIRWALTPFATGRGKGNLQHVQSFEGAKALCALAAEVGYIDAQRAKDLALCTRPQVAVDTLRRLLQNPELRPKDRDYQVRLNYQSIEKNTQAQSGASGFLAYLASQELSLADASKLDLEMWALTPFATGKNKNSLPSSRAFEGAKELCALAAQVGHLDAQQAQAIAECPRPRFDVDSLRMVLHNPALTRKEREYQIRLNYQSAEKDRNLLAGANGFSAYLERQERLLDEVSKSDLEAWALTATITPQGKGTLPSRQAFKGAKALCALAAEVGYINAQIAQGIAECAFPQVGAFATSAAPASEAGQRVAESSSSILVRMNKRPRTDDQGASTSMSYGFGLPQSDALLRDLALSPPTLLELNLHARSLQTGSTQSLIEELESLEDILDSSGNLY